MDNTTEKERPLVGRITAEYFCALCFFITGVVIMWDSYQIGSAWDDAGPQSGYFPFRVGAITCISSVCLMIGIWRSKNWHHDAFVNSSQLKPVLQVLIPILLFTGATQFLGMYVGAFALIAGFMHWLGKYKWMKSIAVGLTVSGLLFWLFEIQFGVPLIKGPLETALGY